MTYENLLKADLRKLLSAFLDGTGFAVATASRLVAKDPKFFGALDGAGIRARTADQVAARFSALWPEGVAWPADVPRPDPADVDEETRALIARRAAKSQSHSPAALLKDWPADMPWPADIPMPDGSNSTNREI